MKPGSKGRILALCTSAGFWDKAFVNSGFEVIAGCELMAHKRELYRQWVGEVEFLAHNICELPALVEGQHFDGVIGGIPCQSRTRIKSFRDPKFPDLLEETVKVLEAITFDWAVFENVTPLVIDEVTDHAGTTHTFNRVKLDAMHYARPHQSRPRWFTHTTNLHPGEAPYKGTVDGLYHHSSQPSEGDPIAYPAVVGKNYGPKRGAILQGWPSFDADVEASCKHKQEALADAVPRCLAGVWVRAANFHRLKQQGE